MSNKIQLTISYDQLIDLKESLQNNIECVEEFLQQIDESYEDFKDSTIYLKRLQDLYNQLDSVEV